ncbi:D-2-hydroxyacid dehydrogenase [Halolamina sp.]|jgi:phosphoglycerate dehydrogenase-like enzyme|uniref:D-2-hydroxyacid dehydrogenase n=1 Tax=Halolamina sp. TaxID=1940283 RepID=UPI000223B76F|nr:Glyoxylate reductase [halophilic archaeon DL31]
MTDAPDVVVLREGTEGLDMAGYADAIRERLPDADVRHARTPHEERDLVQHAPIVTGVGIDEDLLDTAERLELFACAFAGTGHLPTDELEARDVTVTNAGGIHAPGIAEQAIGNILTFARRLHEGWRRKGNREWRHFQSFELTDSTVTIVGLGSIGQAVAQRLEGFEVDTIGVRYTPEKGGPTDEVVGFDAREFHDALARTDYLVVACPLSDLTRGLVGDAELATLPPHAAVVNTARGPILDTDAVVEALQTESLRGVALDVTDPEPLPEDHVLWTLENALITPHTGGHTPKHWDRLADILAHNYDACDSGEELENVVIAG